MAKGKHLKPFKPLIREIYNQIKSDNPEVTAKEVMEAVRKKLHSPDWPKVGSISALLKTWHEQETLADERDELWTYLSMAIVKYPIAPETLPAVLQAWALALDQGIPLTIRQAQWVSRLYYVFKAGTINLFNTSFPSEDSTLTLQLAKAMFDKYIHSTSGLFDDSLISDLLDTARRSAAKEKAASYEEQNYPTTREEILYYWMGDSYLYNQLPMSNSDITTRLTEEFARMYSPETKKRQENIDRDDEKQTIITVQAFENKDKTERGVKWSFKKDNTSQEIKEEGE